MKLYVVLAFLLVALTAVLAAPTEGGKSQDHREEAIGSVNELHLREKRATCQITGVIGEWVGDSACFAHCLWLGHMWGGSCSGGICRCK